MKTSLLLPAVALVAAALTTTALAEDGRPGRGPGGPRGDRGPRMGPPPELLERFDADADGRLDENERRAVRAAIEAGEIEPPAGRGHRPPPRVVARFDADGDGRLDPAERAAARDAREAHGLGDPGEVRRPAGDREAGPRGHRGGPPAELIERFDANGDGHLDAAEREAVHAAVESGEIEPPARRGRRGGDGEVAEGADVPRGPRRSGPRRR